MNLPLKDNGPQVAAPRRKRWRHFSLATFLILVSLIAIAFGWISNHARIAKAEQRAVANLGQVVGSSENGGRPVSGQLNVNFGHRFGTDDYRDIRVLMPEPIGWQKQVTNWLGEDFFVTVKGLTVYGVGNGFQYTVDEEGRYQPKATYVSGLFDKDASILRDLPNIDFLMLEANPIGDAGVRNIGHLKRLKYLNLSNTQITDESAKVIAVLPKLVDLNVSRTVVTDEFVQALLKRRTPLKTLNVKVTRVNDGEIVKVKQAWPHCKVEF